MHDIVVIGGGPAGMAAGVYAGRARLKAVILERLLPGGQAAVTDFIENYPGFPEGISGPELTARMEEHVRKFGCEIKYEEVTSVDVRAKEVVTPAGVYTFQALIIAIGAEPRRLNVPGEEDLIGRGISFCATCDGAFFSGKKVAVVGGGDSALKEAMFLTKFASRVFVIHRRDELRAEKIIQEKAFQTPTIAFVWDTVITEIVGEGTVKGLKVQNVRTGAASTLDVDGLFIYIGRKPETAIFEVEKDEYGYIVTDENMNTSVEGVFAAGDCRKKEHRQVATAVGDGVTAAMSAEKYVESL